MLPRCWARWRSRERPVRPSLPEMIVSRWLEPRRGLPASPTREGSSPPSSPANVCKGQYEGGSRGEVVIWSLDCTYSPCIVSMYNREQVKPQVMSRITKHSHSLLVSTIRSPKIVPQSAHTCVNGEYGDPKRHFMSRPGITPHSNQIIDGWQEYSSRDHPLNTLQ